MDLERLSLWAMRGGIASAWCSPGLSQFAALLRMRIRNPT
jgi:hypothetical protein